jgi:hypothetical protein
MAMTALINKLTSRPFVLFWNVPSKSTRAGRGPGGGLPPENLAATVGDYNPLPYSARTSRLIEDRSRRDCAVLGSLFEPVLRGRADVSSSK